jgi:hypothetical protein
MIVTTVPKKEFLTTFHQHRMSISNMKVIIYKNFRENQNDQSRSLGHWLWLSAPLSHASHQWPGLAWPKWAWPGLAHGFDPGQAHPVDQA